MYLDRELNDELLQVKINYLNGYLTALEFVNSYSIVGMRYKLFSYHYIGGDVERGIQNNAYELFGVYPNDWEIELVQIENWEDILQTKLEEIFICRSTFWNDSNYSIRNAFKHFIYLLKHIVIPEAAAYELKVTRSGHYRIIGIDLVFEISGTKILVLQILGND